MNDTFNHENDKMTSIFWSTAQNTTLNSSICLAKLTNKKKARGFLFVIPPIKHKLRCILYFLWVVYTLIWIGSANTVLLGVMYLCWLKIKKSDKKVFYITYISLEYPHTRTKSTSSLQISETTNSRSELLKKLFSNFSVLK